MSQPSELDVSVVVPVYNTGQWIEDCIESLINQSLPSDRYEVIFVDDGSTDKTPQRLDELATETANVKVFHEPNSGWPGRPRNIGIDNARGRYVFFCDHDDWLEAEALQRMVAYADEHGADVLIPKMVGHRRTVPRTLFMKSVPDATVLTAPLMSSLTPHKLFRRSFLNDVGLRFPEGKRRLEDHVFVITAYFTASKIAVLADRPYYHHVRREDDANAAFDQVEPAFYYKFVREVIDTIEAHTEPGPERQTAMDRPFSGSILRRARRPASHWRDAEDYQRAVFEEAQAVLLERYPPDFADHLLFGSRVRANALRAGDFATVAELNERSDTLRGRGSVESLDWVRDHWRIAFRVTVGFEDGEPFRLTPAGDDRWLVDPRLMPAAIRAEATPSTEDLLRVPTTVAVVERPSSEEWLLRRTVSAATRELPDATDGSCEVVVDGTTNLDPMSCAGGAPLSNGLWDLVVRCNVLGTELKTRLAGNEDLIERFSADKDAGPASRSSVAFFTPSKFLAIDVGKERRRRKRARAAAAFKVG